MNKLRRQAMDLLRAWHEEIEGMATSSTHPLASVRDFQLDDRKRAGAGRVYAVETRPTGRSRVPIREISEEANIVTRLLRDVRDVDERYHRALELWVRSYSFDSIAKAMKTSKTRALINFDCGLAIFQRRILDTWGMQ